MQVPEEFVLNTAQQATNSGTDTFFHGGHWGQCLELLSHLCQYGETVLLVSGPAGIGKSALKQALVAGLANECVFCEVQVTAQPQAEQLLAQIEAGFDAALDNCQHKELVLLVEDAQNISVEIMSSLFQLKQTINAAGHLHIVLFARPYFEQNMQSSSLREQFTQDVQVIEVEPLTLNEVEAFLRYLWNLAGNQAEFPIDKTGIKKIHSLSGGIPGQVQQLAKTFFEGKNINKSTEGGRTRLSPFAVGLTVTFGLVFCLLAFFWPTSDDVLIMQSQPVENLAALDHPSEAAPQSTPLSLPGQITQPTLDEVQTTAQDMHNEQSTAEPIVSAEEKLARLEEKLISLQQQLAEEQVARRNAELKLQTVQQKPLAQAQKDKTTSKNKSAYTKEEKHILSMPSKNYTLQILGASNEQKIMEFIKTNNLGSKAHYFRSTYQGKPWYIIIYGNYPTRAAANSAANELPSELKKLQPWPREYAYVQRTIKKK